MSDVSQIKNKIAQDAAKLLEVLIQQGSHDEFHGEKLKELTGLNVDDLNDAVDFLDNRRLIERIDALGTHPYNFYGIILNARGRYAYHEATQSTKKEETHSVLYPVSAILSNIPTLPVGSPFGFVDTDWEYIQKLKKQHTKLFVVMGCQSESPYYNTTNLKNNIKATFESALEKYNENERGRKEKITLEFKPLVAGYGEHLFNQIARDIIASDITIFETSDLNPNVMIELGVALTWGSRVLLIKKSECPKPPSDISGQTWCDYVDDASKFVNPHHEEDLVAMIERAIQKKSSR